MRRKYVQMLIFIIISSVFITQWTEKIISDSQLERLTKGAAYSAEYREQKIGEQLLPYLKKFSNPGKVVGLYLLDSKFGYDKTKNEYADEDFARLEKRWKGKEKWDVYLEATESIWNDVKYFPVPLSTVSVDFKTTYVNTWMSERTYGGNRGHEGTDIMAKNNQRGVCPIVSMTDGKITKKGWLDKGGYRIGVEAPGGAYFYYAHLDSYADIEVGDTVSAGDILGFMGDSGYGTEGTKGNFPVHLHLGIYLYSGGKEVSVNPYWVLRYIENSKVKCYTES